MKLSGAWQRPTVGFSATRLNSQLDTTDPDDFAAFVVSQLRFEGTPDTQVFADDRPGVTWGPDFGTPATMYLRLDDDVAPPWGTTSGYFSAGYGITTGVDSDLSLPTEFTAEMWLRHSGTSGYQTVFDNRKSPDGIGVYLFNANTVGRNIVIYDDQALLLSTPSGSLPPAGQWFHLAISRNASNLVRVHVDGTQIGSYTDSRTYSANPQTFSGGDGTGSNGLYGRVKDFRLTTACRYNGLSFTPPGELLPLA